MATKITKSELKQMIREALREELSKKKCLKEATRTTPYTEADFEWDDAAMLAEYKAAALAYLNGADIEDALADIKANLTTVGGIHLARGGTVRESVDNIDDIDEIYYITYQDSYGDSFTSYFITASDYTSKAHWDEDLQHFFELDPDDKTCLIRAEVELTGSDAKLACKLLDKEWNDNDAALWARLDELVDRLARSGKLEELDNSYDY